MFYLEAFYFSADNDGVRRKKKKIGLVREEAGLALGSQPSFSFENTDRIKKIIGTAQPDVSYTSKENLIKDIKEVRIHIWLSFPCTVILNHLFYSHMKVL